MAKLWPSYSSYSSLNGTKLLQSKMSKECDDFEVLLTTEDLQKHKDNIRKLRELVSQKEQQVTELSAQVNGLTKLCKEKHNSQHTMILSSKVFKSSKRIMQLEQTLASQKLNQKSLDHLMQEVRKNLTEENQSLRANIRSMEEICQKGEQETIDLKIQISSLQAQLFEAQLKLSSESSQRQQLLDRLAERDKELQTKNEQFNKLLAESERSSDQMNKLMGKLKDKAECTLFLLTKQQKCSDHPSPNDSDSSKQSISKYRRALSESMTREFSQQIPAQQPKWIVEIINTNQKLNFIVKNQEKLVESAKQQQIRLQEDINKLKEEIQLQTSKVAEAKKIAQEREKMQREFYLQYEKTHGQYQSLLYEYGLYRKETNGLEISDIVTLFYQLLCEMREKCEQVEMSEEETEQQLNQILKITKESIDTEHKNFNSKRKGQKCKWKKQSIGK